MSQSHLIPFTDMAKLLAHQGQQVTIVMTPLNAARYKTSTIDYAVNFDLKIQFLSVSFPGQEFGLPKECENMDSLPSMDLSTKFFQASNMLQEPLKNWLQGLDSLPSCIISDICFPWTSNLALKFRIPRVVFHTVSCFTLLCSQSINRDSVTSDSELVLVPDVPDRIEFTKAQLPDFEKQIPDDNLKNLFSQFKEAEFSANAVLVNSFEEMESWYVKAYRKFVHNLWCIGPLSLCKETLTSNKIEQESLNWLNSHKPSSVIYVCFGSLSRMGSQQLIELGLGLEASNIPFIWTIKEGDYTEKLEKWFKEQRFEQRIKDRGLIIRGWAPQIPILSHPATGGFLTHCGWNSTLEAVSSGLPMITWPMFAEQFYNEKFIVQVLKIGVKIGVEVPMKSEVLMVQREDIMKAMKQLVDGGNEGEERRKRAKKLGDMAKRAVENGGSSHLNVTLLIQHLNQTGIELISTKQEQF